MKKNHSKPPLKVVTSQGKPVKKVENLDPFTAAIQPPALTSEEKTKLKKKKRRRHTGPRFYKEDLHVIQHLMDHPMITFEGFRLYMAISWKDTCSKQKISGEVKVDKPLLEMFRVKSNQVSRLLHRLEEAGFLEIVQMGRGKATIVKLIVLHPF